jgi:uncharacterized protein (DUF488 family)
VSAVTQISILTVGHSNHPLEHFIELLRRHGVTALADVRSKPYSRANPQFNQEAFRLATKLAGIAYVFLGKELGARTDDPACYDHGKVRYDRLASTELFQRGLERLREGATRYRLAMMCAEGEPLACHRTILVAKHLLRHGVDVQHIHVDGRLESHADAMSRLTHLLKMPAQDMFHSPEDILEDAYKRQEERIAYVASVPDSASRV